MPFEVPESWVWVKLKDIAEITSSKRIFQNEYIDNGIPFYRTKEIVELNAYKPISTILYISEKRFDEIRQIFGVPQEKDILISAVGTIGISWIVDGRKFYFKDGNLLWIRNINVDSYYLKHVLDNVFLNSSFGHGGAYNALTIERLKAIIIPIPPLQEQQRIVSKIEECFVLINQIEENKFSLSQFIKQTKSKVLDLAIRGKLVPQNPNDEPASVLLERIKKEHKPKKSTSDISHYTDNDFQIPDNWKVIAMQNICFLSDGEKIEGKTLPYLDVKYLRKKGEIKMQSSGKFVSKNSTMILVDGENSGELFSVTKDGYQGSTLKILNVSDFVDKDFIFKILQKEQSTFRESKIGSAIPHLNKKLFRELPIFLPPLAEQKRIVSKIEQIFAQLDEIQSSITN